MPALSQRHASGAMGVSDLEPSNSAGSVYISEEDELAEARAMGWDSEHLAQIEKAIFNHRGKSAALH